MENPHEKVQNSLLSRIIANMVSLYRFFYFKLTFLGESK